MAHIDKRTTTAGEPRYEVRYRLPDGRERSRTYRTHDDAMRFKRKVEADELAGLVSDYRAADETLRAYACRWIETRVVKGRPLTPATRYGYERLLARNILPTLGDRRLRQLRPEVVREWYATLAASAGTSQAAKSYTLLRAILNTAVSDDLLVANPCRIRGGGVEQPDERPMLPTGMVLDLAEAIDRRYRALVMLAGIGALRTGELLGLRRCDVDLVHGYVDVVRQAQEVPGRGRIIVPPKSDAGRRRVALPRQLVTALDEHITTFSASGAEGAVFTGPEGTPLRRATLSVAWQAACRKVGAPAGIRVHDLRHHGATTTARMPGITLRELMARIGHSSPRAALVYQHATAERDRDMAAFLERELDQIERRGPTGATPAPPTLSPPRRRRKAV